LLPVIETETEFEDSHVRTEVSRVFLDRETSGVLQMNRESKIIGRIREKIHVGGELKTILRKTASGLDVEKDPSISTVTSDPIHCSGIEEDRMILLDFDSFHVRRESCRPAKRSPRRQIRTDRGVDCRLVEFESVVEFRRLVDDCSSPSRRLQDILSNVQRKRLSEDCRHGRKFTISEEVSMMLRIESENRRRSRKTFDHSTISE